MSSHPIQPLYKDDSGVIRFKSNAIVRYLLDNGGLDLNHLAVQGFSQEDQEQFAQLIGYSLNGFSELSYVRDETFYAAEKMSAGRDERDGRIAALTETLEAIRKGLRVAASAAFRVHPDDLQP